MRIHTDNNGVAVNAITAQGVIDTTGHVYQILAGPKQVQVEFQFGPVKVYGVNGATSEAYLAILIHRLQHLNSLFPCAENQRALNHMQLALEALESRTKDRLARGVEGENQA
jgi:hypothetical protein